MQWRFPTEGHGPYRLLRGVDQALVARWHRSCEQPQDAQRGRLQAILRESAPTAFGRDHGLRPDDDLDAWRRKVPIRSHDELLPWLSRVHAGEPEVLTRSPVRSLLKTSGTTGASKLIPVTAPFAREVAEGQSLWRLALIRDHEAITQGKALTVVSPAVEGRLASGLPYGSNTGRMQAEQPWYVRLRYPVPAEVFAIEDAEARTYCLLRYALQAPLSSITTANPSTLLLLCRKLLEHRESLAADLRAGTLRRGPAASIRLSRRARLRLRRRAPPSDWRPARIWNLATVNCWKGGPARFFLERLPGALGAEVPVREVGITASEGYFAVPVGDGDEGGVAWLGGHLLEFLDEEDRPHWAWELEPGRPYRLVISTSGGLYRYDLNDVVECTGFAASAPVLRFLRKAGNVLSVTGEKLTEDQLARAMAGLPSMAGAVGFTVGHHMAEVPCLRVAVEGVEPAAEEVDRALRAANIEYDAKRDSGRLGLPRVERLPEGTYARFRAMRLAEGATAGQVKDPLVALDEAAWERLSRAARG